MFVVCALIINGDNTDTFPMGSSLRIKSIANKAKYPNIYNGDLESKVIIITHGPFPG